MALLAEEIVEEWLNRNGYFTIRGIKLGVHEIDLLAIKISDSIVEARHIEVQASINPVSYICPLPRITQKETWRKPMSMKLRTLDELIEGVDEWVKKKFHHEAKRQLRSKLFPGEWSYELVLHHIKFSDEIPLIEKHGIKITYLDDIIDSLSNSQTDIPKASGADLLELVMLRQHRRT